jgi:hypothetical protein
MKHRFLSILLTIFFLMAMVSPAIAARDYQGKPSKHDAGNTMGYYIWQDGTRWNVRTVNAGSQHLFTGTVETDGALTDVTTLQSEKVDRVAVNVSSEKIDFHFNSAAKTDGFSFTAISGQNLTFTLYVDGMPVDPSNIYYGNANRHPNNSSFNARMNDDNSSNDNYHNPYNPNNSQQLQGRPAAWNPGNVLGYFIWQEGDRWYLQTTTKGAERQFTGTVQTNGTFADMNRNNLENNDRTSTNNAGNEINFDLKTTGDMDGLSFRLDNSAAATFTLYLDGQPVNPSEVYIGNANRHPDTNSFTISRNEISNNSTNYSNSSNGNAYNRIDSSRFQGQPTALNPGNVFGYFIWQDQNRWYLQTTTTGAERQFKGVIETEGTFSAVEKIRPLRTDGTVVDASSSKIDFAFKTGGSASGISLSFPEGLKLNQSDKVSGLSFRTTDGAMLNFTLYVDGANVDPSNIYIGRSNWHPSSNVIQTYTRN